MKQQILKLENEKIAIITFEVEPVQLAIFEKTDEIESVEFSTALEALNYVDSKFKIIGTKINKL